MYVVSNGSPLNLELNVELESNLQELPLWKVYVELDTLGSEVAQLFEQEPLLPGIILTRNQNYVGMISRRTFFEHMSRPFSLGLFSGRPIEHLYNSIQPETFILPRDTPIVKASQMALRRQSEYVYEPIVVQAPFDNHGVLDFHQLLLAYCQIQTLTSSQLQRAEEQSKRAETSLQDLQKNYILLLNKEKSAVLRQILASITQEIKNPIDFITGNLIHINRRTQELLHLISLYQQQYPTLGREIQAVINQLEIDFLIADTPKLLDSMKVNSKRIQQVVRSFHNFYQLHESESQVVDIHELIDITLLLLQSRLRYNSNRERIILIKDYGNIPPVNCSAWQLNQVFMNILNNAIDALEERRNNEKQFLNPQIIIHTETLDSHVVIRIVDNGLGMSQELKKQVFNPLFPTNAGTLKFGLSLSYQIIVEEYGGQLECISAPGKGSEFIIKIPSLKIAVS